MTTENPAKPTDVDKALLGTATYRSLGEQKLSPQEERFEKGRRTVGLFLAPLLTIVFLVLPIDIPREQQVLAAVLLGVIALWISEAVPIPIGGLLGVAVAVFLGVALVDDVLGPFGSSTIFTFIGAFILAQAMLKHGVARRFAFRILSLPRPRRKSCRLQGSPTLPSPTSTNRSTTVRTWPPPSPGSAASPAPAKSSKGWIPPPGRLQSSVYARRSART